MRSRNYFKSTAKKEYQSYQIQINILHDEASNMSPMAYLYFSNKIRPKYGYYHFLLKHTFKL